MATTITRTETAWIDATVDRMLLFRRFDLALLLWLTERKDFKLIDKLNALHTARRKVVHQGLDRTIEEYKSILGPLMGALEDYGM